MMSREEEQANMFQQKINEYKDHIMRLEDILNKATVSRMADGSLTMQVEYNQDEVKQLPGFIQDRYNKLK